MLDRVTRRQICGGTSRTAATRCCRDDVRQVIEAVEERERVLVACADMRPSHAGLRHHSGYCAPPSTTAIPGGIRAERRPSLVEQRHAARREARHDTTSTLAAAACAAARDAGHGEELAVDDVEEVARRETVRRVDDVGLAPADELLAGVDRETGRG